MSVSSIRRMNVPPVFRAKSQLYSAVRTLPICNWPVGEGANRTRTLPLSAINLMVTKSDASAGVRGETNFLVRSFASQRFRPCLPGGDRGPALFPPLRGFGSRLRAGAQQRPRNSVMPPQLVFIYKGPCVAQTDGGCGKSAGNGPVATPDDRQSLAVKCSELKLGRAHARCSLAVYQKEILEQDP